MAFPDSRPFDRAMLGRTGLEVCRLGVAAGYGVPAAAVERAFEEGVNYLYWGSRRSGGFAEAIRNLAPHRERFLLVVQSYSRVAGLVAWSVERALRAVRCEYADFLLLGLWNGPVWPRILDAARSLRQRGLVRRLALSTHNRRLVRQLADGADFDVFHVRYSAVHTGAERDIFPHLGGGSIDSPPENAEGTSPGPGGQTVRPGIVAFTATSWRRLLGHRRIPKSEPTPTAGDCYRFVLTNPAVDVCLSGPSSAAQMAHALEALRKGPMSEEEMAWMRRVGRAIYGKR